MAHAPVLCPSALCQEGSLLLGIVLPDGRVALAKERIVVDQGFVENARQGRSPEERFRFANTCRQGGCRQWTGSRCGVIDDVLQQSEPHAIPATLPACAVRDECRWFQQAGGRACMVCPEVITDQRPSKSVVMGEAV